jgi:hypothetical protein
MIDKSTGHITIEKVLIKPNDLESDIASFKLGQTRDKQDMQNGWTWLTEKNISSDNKFFIFTFAFFDKKLKAIDITLQDKKFDLTQGWDSWSEEKELKTLKQLKTWLKKELGTQESFEWGTALAVYDAKGGASVIKVKYKN